MAGGKLGTNGDIFHYHTGPTLHLANLTDTLYTHMRERHELEGTYGSSERMSPLWSQILPKQRHIHLVESNTMETPGPSICSRPSSSNIASSITI
eukprot:1161784-Pelagomonas_calceolata.AAC.1